jgi:hypothetical protein
MSSTTAATKLDHKKLFKHLYTATAQPTLVEVPPLTYLMIDGHGNPNTSAEYGEAIQTLYTVAYGAKFALKKSGGPDLAVMPLQGLWWAADLTAFTTGDKDAWDWRMMIMMPDEMPADVIARARATASAKVPAPTLERLHLERFAEGRAAQILHVGPYADEGPTIERLHTFISDQGLCRTGKHHELYLGDPRRAAPEKLRTIIRQPVGEAPGR